MNSSSIESGSEKKPWPWVPLFKGLFNPMNGYVTSYDDLLGFVKSYETATHSKFSKGHQKGQFGKKIDSLQNYCTIEKGRQIRWKIVNSKFQWKDNTYPFLQIGTKSLYCMYGKKYKPSPKHEDISRRRKTSTKKLGCRASITVVHIVEFKGIQFKAESHRKRHESVKKLAGLLRENSPVDYQEKFFISLPELKEHTNHMVGEAAASKLPMDEQLKKYIRDILAQEVVASSGEMKIRLEEYVKQTLFKGKPPPAKTNSRYWPSTDKIRSVMNAYCRRKGNLHPNGVSSVKATKFVPIFKGSWPPEFVKVVRKRWNALQRKTPAVERLSQWEFVVTSGSRNNLRHNVNIRSDRGFMGDPSCTCKIWKRDHSPCRHLLCLVYLEFVTFNDIIQEKYAKNPFYSVDVSTVAVTINPQPQPQPSQYQAPQPPMDINTWYPTYTIPQNPRPQAASETVNETKRLAKRVMDLTAIPQTSDQCNYLKRDLLELLDRYGTILEGENAFGSTHNKFWTNNQF